MSERAEAWPEIASAAQPCTAEGRLREIWPDSEILFAMSKRAICTVTAMPRLEKPAQQSFLELALEDLVTRIARSFAAIVSCGGCWYWCVVLVHCVFLESPPTCLCEGAAVAIMKLGKRVQTRSAISR